MVTGQRKRSGNSQSTYLSLVHALRSKQMQSLWFGLYWKNLTHSEKRGSWAISNNTELLLVWQKLSQDPPGTDISIPGLRGTQKTDFTRTGCQPYYNIEAVPQTSKKLLLAYKTKSKTNFLGPSSNHLTFISYITWHQWAVLNHEQANTDIYFNFCLIFKATHTVLTMNENGSLNMFLLSTIDLTRLFILILISNLHRYV